jgi:hypothetical protein
MNEEQFKLVMPQRLDGKSEEYRQGFVDGYVSCQRDFDSMLSTAKYTDYYAVESSSGVIGLVTCLKCGAAIICNESQANAQELHDKYHSL